MKVEVVGVAKSFDGREALSIPELRIPSGQVFGLVGSNGAGKTTFLRLLLDLILPDSGDVYINGENVRTTISWKTFTGSFLDDSFLIEFLTADEFLNFLGRIYEVPKPDMARAILPFQSFYPDEILGQTKKFIRELSRGNAKKVGLIGAMFFGPQLLILDEPFATLDPRSQIKLKQLIADLSSKYGTTAIISSHDLLHVSEICDR
ncbi:MAG: ABC transporter ATP-binding protein, partial [Rhodothermales bacterium]|nr:ABC transporter ATP-binding protein [Rhodothermales bacterium]